MQATRRSTTTAGHVEHRPWALRLGVLASGRIVEEIIVADPGKVTVGQSDRNTLLVADPRLPARLSLFESHGSRWHLNARPYMQGRVGGATGMVTLGGSAPRRIELDERSRGRIRMGDTIILFQFVPRPPTRPRPQLPSAVRGAWLSAILSLFMAAEGFIGWLWVASLATSLSLVTFFNVHDWPVHEEGIVVDNVYQRLLVTPPPQPSEDATRERVDSRGEDTSRDQGEEPVETESGPGEEIAKRPAKSHDQASSDSRSASEATRKARLEAALNDTALLTVLGSLAGSEEGGGADMLRGNSVPNDIDDVLAKVASVKTGGAMDTGSSLGGFDAGAKTDMVASLDEVGAGEAVTDKVNVGPAVEKEVKGLATFKTGEEVDGTGILDTASVNKVVKKNMGALRNCYEKGLKGNAGLGGKISVKFTINANGRVSSTSTTADTMGDPQVASCVLSKFEGMKFDKPQGGSVTYVFPLVFKSAN